MRPTINLSDGFTEAAKARAAAEGRTPTSPVVEGLRAAVDRAPEPQTTRTLPSFGDSDGVLLVDLDDRNALAAELDAGGHR